MPRFSIDTSSLLEAWVRVYPPDIFPTFWARFEESVDAGIIIASREVLGELQNKDDGISAWAKEREEMFREIDDAVQHVVSRLMGRYPKLVDERRTKSAGDPWVIALAATHDPPLTVVTQEVGGTNDKPKIPSVCAAEGIRCVNLVTLIRDLGWRI